MMLLDYFGFLVGFLEKWTKSANFEREAWKSLGYAEA